MNQLERIYQSVAKSIWSTVSASFPSACAAVFLTFFFYTGIRILHRRCTGRQIQTPETVHMVRQGFWLGLFAGYTYMVLFRTWIARPGWEEPLGKIFEGWGLYTKKGKFTTEAIENGMLLFPFTWLLGMLLRERWRKRPAVSALAWLTLGGFFMSLTIETVQLLWKRGTFQFSDLFYNTLGGMLGGLLFVIGRW